MKTKVKMLSLSALILCLLMAVACLFTACGEGGEDEVEARDYTTYTYADWAAIPITEWDAKTITYQIFTGESGNLRLCVNLYDDGTMVIYESGIYTTDPEAMPDAAWVDEDLHIVWDFYGFWKEEGNTIELYYLCSKSNEDATVEMTAEWAESKFNFYLPIYDHQIVQDLENLQAATNLMYLGVNTQGQIWPIGGDTGVFDVLSGDDILYPTLQAYLDSYKDELFPPL